MEIGSYPVLRHEQSKERTKENCHYVQKTDECFELQKQETKLRNAKLNFASCGKTEAFINSKIGISTYVVFGMIRAVLIIC